MEDESGQISASSRTDLYEARSIDDPDIILFGTDHCRDDPTIFWTGHSDMDNILDGESDMITDVVLPMIGIVLIALILVVWL